VILTIPLKQAVAICDACRVSNTGHDDPIVLQRAVDVMGRWDELLAFYNFLSDWDGPVHVSLDTVKESLESALVEYLHL